MAAHWKHIWSFEDNLLTEDFPQKMIAEQSFESSNTHHDMDEAQVWRMLTS